MTTVLSTLNRLEQARFEAFRRSTLRGDAISTYVAHCLAASQERTYAKNIKSRQLLGVNDMDELSRAQQHCPYITSDGNNTTTTTSSADATTTEKDATTSTPTTNTSRRETKLQLSDMVPPGQADEITIVVSTLAKNYAQRLVMAARRVASAEGVQDSTPLSPSHVRKAHHARVQAGLDPGFYLQTCRREQRAGAESSASVAAALGVEDLNTLSRNAALHAQEEYDKYVKEKRENGNDGAEAMNVDNRDGGGQEW